jgi:hypothetical protein
MMFGGGSTDNEEATTTSSAMRDADDDDDGEYNKATESISDEDDNDNEDEDGEEYSEEDEEEEDGITEHDDETTEHGDEITEHHDDDHEATDDEDSYEEGTDDDEDSHDEVSHDDDEEEISASGSFSTAKQSLLSIGSEVIGGKDANSNNRDTIFSIKPLSSSNSSDGSSRDRQNYSSHSFASDATEDRGHRSRSVSPQKAMISPRNKKENNLLPPTSSGHFWVNNKDSTVISPGGLSTNSLVPSTTTGDNNNSTITTAPTPRILENRQRIPGGAAAKLFGRRNDVEYLMAKTDEDDDESLLVVAPIDELIKSRDMAKAEFSLGSTENKRYRHAPTTTTTTTNTLPKDGGKDLPRILDRSEVFHQNAAAAIVSILTPSNKSMVDAPEIDQILSTRSDVDIQTTNSTGGNGNSNNKSLMKAKSRKDQSSSMVHPSKRGDTLSTIKSIGSDTSNAVGDAIETMSMTGKSPLVQQLLTKKTERRLASINSRMKDPTKNLIELMEAIASPKSGLFDRHYMVRRKNACGALKVLTANASHRVNICWTLGVLPTLVSVLEDCGPHKLEDTFPDVSIRREYFEARKRAVSALVNLAIPQDNKLPIFHCPRLVASLILVINQDDEEARRGCCAVLAYLSKSKENRLIMAQVPGLLDAVSGVIEPKENLSRSNTSKSFHSDDSEQQDIFDKLSKDNFDKKTPLEDETEEEDPAEVSARYDEDPNEFLHSSRQNVFALLSHLVKEKDNAFVLARHSYLIDTLVAITRLQESSSQDFGLKLLAHLSRHRSNSKILVFKMKEVVPAIVFATHSENGDSRKYACFALQNFSQDKPCRQQLASIENLLPAVCRRIRGAKDQEEKLAALHTLKNLTDEPANLIPMTNTPECFATLMQVAHASDESVTETMQYLGCDALATLSHWFRSIATSGQRIGSSMKQPNSDNANVKDVLFVPTLRVLNWEPWQ